MSYRVPQPDHMKGKDPWTKGVRSAGDALPPGVTRMTTKKPGLMASLLKKLSADEAAAAQEAFALELQKHAFLGTVGKAVLGGVGRGAKALGVNDTYRKGLSAGAQALGGGKTGVTRMRQVAGGVALGGAGLAAHKALT